MDHIAHRGVTVAVRIADRPVQKSEQVHQIADGKIDMSSTLDHLDQVSIFGRSFLAFFLILGLD
jgi:hypothetical protein